MGTAITTIDIRLLDEAYVMNTCIKPKWILHESAA